MDVIFLICSLNMDTVLEFGGRLSVGLQNLETELGGHYLSVGAFSKIAFLNP